MVKPMPISASRIWRYVCVIGCSLPLGWRLMPGSVTSSVSFSNALCCIIAAIFVLRSAIACSSSFLTAFEAWPSFARCSLSSWPIVLSMPVSEPLLPRMEALSASSSFSSRTSLRRSSASCLILSSASFIFQKTSYKTKCAPRL